MPRKRKLTRSENMARIRGRDTKPEIKLRKALWAAGFRYRLSYPLPGRPDLVFPKARLAVFVDGCFWHGCPLHYSAPKTRQEFWKNKLRTNVLRDMAVEDELVSLDWKVFRIWEHDLSDTEQAVSEISKFLDNGAAMYNADVSPVMNVAESIAPYGLPHNTTPWWTCHCGSSDIRVLAISGPGSLRPNSQNRPESAELICRKCRKIFHADLTQI
ncbi:very short patch repair endonuclease [Desulfonema ishimotonii]|uniref:Very short patch repair endonuclease n=1 Tax=Desulfonema ishimotonii TaxID=45657 RepID=A0A401FRK2_9BACT|nr:very short patch repair endonuclease [Desulfonema ishimotonii]GBC59594.1 very short patch repair endonuclease [Desulfonema ishimotonii]